ncbi:50S ribosomal protein L24 [bacterium]|nr:50S ribosomal protein L24 [bacterium]
MKIKKGDKIKMLAGKDKGKTGKVLQVSVAEKRASIEGLNLLIKHLRPRRQGEKGQRIEFPALVDMSNLGLICPKCGKVTRVEYKVVETENGKKKYRQCKKCNETFA